MMDNGMGSFQIIITVICFTDHIGSGGPQADKRVGSGMEPVKSQQIPSADEHPTGAAVMRLSATECLLLGAPASLIQYFPHVFHNVFLMIMYLPTLLTLFQ